MCVVSNIMDQYRPYIPQQPWVPTSPGIGTNPPPQINIQQQPIVDPKELRELIDSFHKALEAAREFDRLTGQPDCEDEEKIKLVDRVTDLERRLDALAEAAQA